MTSRQPFVYTFLMTGLLLGGLAFQANAARKYYPPGFTPPAGTMPTLDPNTPPSNVLIKRVPVNVPEKPRDPLSELLEEQRLFEALRLLDKRIAEAPGNLSLRILKAQVLRRSGSFDPAIEEYYTVLKQTRSTALKASAYNGLGWTYYAQALHTRRLGDEYAAKRLNTQAEIHFKQALQLNPKQLHGWLGLAQWALSQGNLEQAEAAMAEAQSLDPKNTQVLLSQAELLVAQKKPEEAQALIYKAKNQSPREPNVFLALGKTSLALARYDDAIIQFKQLLDLSPENPEALRLLSLAYENKMKPEDAEQALKKAINLNPGDVEATRALLKIYDQAGEPERALLFLQQLAKQQPDHQVYQTELLERLYRIQRWDDAYRHGLKFIEAVEGELSASHEPFLQPFSRVVFQQGKGMVDHQPLLSNPSITRVVYYYRGKLEASPQDPEVRLRLLLLDPLHTLPPLEAAPNMSEKDAPPEQLGLSIQAAFLEGEWSRHQQLLERLSDTPGEAPFLVSLSQLLLDLNDYQGAQTVARLVKEDQPEHQAAQALYQKATEAEGALEDHLQAIKKLSRKIPDQYWQQAASSALTAGSGHWEVHAELSGRLNARKKYDLAHRQQMLTARYAPDESSRKKWLKQAEKNRKH